MRFCSARRNTRPRNRKAKAPDDHLDDREDRRLEHAAGDYTREHPRPEDVFLLIEVADTTLESDRADKLPVYGRAGVVEVWIINLVELTIEIYRGPHFTGYASKTIAGTGHSIAPLACPDAILNTTELFNR